MAQFTNGWNCSLSWGVKIFKVLWLPFLRPWVRPPPFCVQPFFWTEKLILQLWQVDLIFFAGMSGKLSGVNFEVETGAFSSIIYIYTWFVDNSSIDFPIIETEWGRFLKGYIPLKIHWNLNNFDSFFINDLAKIMGGWRILLHFQRWNLPCWYLYIYIYIHIKTHTFYICVMHTVYPYTIY